MLRRAWSLIPTHPLLELIRNLTMGGQTVVLLYTVYSGYAESKASDIRTAATYLHTVL